MKLQIRQKDRRALLLLVAALGIYGLVQVGVLPAYDRLIAARDLAADKEAQVRRYRRAELRKGEYADLLKLAADRIARDESVVISAANLPLASAELQSLVEGAGSKVGLMVSQRTIGTPRRLNDFYAELPMTLSFESTPGQLVSFLSELRTLPRFLTVRSLQIAPIQPVLEAPKGSNVTKDVRVVMAVSSLAFANIVKAEAVRR